MFLHEHRKTAGLGGSRTGAPTVSEKEGLGSLSVCGAYVFHRWRSESLPAHQRPGKLLLGAKFMKRVLQFLIRPGVKVWNSLQQRWHHFQVEVLGMYAPPQIPR